MSAARKPSSGLWRVGIVLLAAAPALQASEAPDGRELFRTRCGMCHQTNGMGVGLLSRRPADASKGLLEAREDLSTALVKVVVRHGIGNMPRLPRGEVADPELESIAQYLSRGKP
jgi:mono/diheme cytochrome c family protein